MAQVFIPRRNECGHEIGTDVGVYEVRLSTMKSGDKWRRNHVALVVDMDVLIADI